MISITPREIADTGERQPTDTRSTKIDTSVAVASAAIYFILVLVLLSPDEYLRALGGGIFVFGAIIMIGRRTGRGPLPGMSILIVAFTSAIILEFPTFPAMGGTDPISVPVGFLGVQVAVMLWAAWRWSPLPPQDEYVSLMQAWKFGAIAAIALSAVATIPVLLTVRAGGRSQLPMFLIYPAYFGGLLSAATAYWLLQRISHLAMGRYLIGFIGGTCVYAAVAPVVELSDKDPMNIGTMLMLAAVCGGLVGPAVTLNRTE
jgi:hypothetical protein